MPKIKDIPNALVEKKNDNRTPYMLTDQWDDDFARAFNQAIDQQGLVKIGLNRERLAEILSNHIYGKKELQYPLADAIIAAESTLLEVKNNGE